MRAQRRLRLACAQVDQSIHSPPEYALDPWLPTHEKKVSSIVVTVALRVNNRSTFFLLSVMIDSPYSSRLSLYNDIELGDFVCSFRLGVNNHNKRIFQPYQS